MVSVVGGLLEKKKWARQVSKHKQTKNGTRRDGREEVCGRGGRTCAQNARAIAQRLRTTGRGKEEDAGAAVPTHAQPNPGIHTRAEATRAHEYSYMSGTAQMNIHKHPHALTLSLTGGVARHRREEPILLSWVAQPTWRGRLHTDHVTATSSSM